MVTKLMRLSLAVEGEIWAKGAWVKEGRNGQTTLL